MINQTQIEIVLTLLFLVLIWTAAFFRRKKKMKANAIVFKCSGYPVAKHPFSGVAGEHVHIQHLETSDDAVAETGAVEFADNLLNWAKEREAQSREASKRCAEAGNLTGALEQINFSKAWGAMAVYVEMEKAKIN